MKLISEEGLPLRFVYNVGMEKKKWGIGIWLGLIVGGIFLVYLLIPTPPFPEPLTDSPQSQEPGDVLDLENRRAYFTDNQRAEIISHYQVEMQHRTPWKWIPSYRLNYPPEEALWYVYDPLKSSYLEEVVFPFRESLYINGYEPKDGQDAIAFEGKPYVTKVTLKYYRSPVIARVAIAGTSLVVLWVMIGMYWNEFKLIWRDLVKPKV